MLFGCGFVSYELARSMENKWSDVASWFERANSFRITTRDFAGDERVTKSTDIVKAWGDDAVSDVYPPKINRIFLF